MLCSNSSMVDPSGQSELKTLTVTGIPKPFVNIRVQTGWCSWADGRLQPLGMSLLHCESYIKSNLRARERMSDKVINKCSIWPFSHWAILFDILPYCKTLTSPKILGHVKGTDGRC